ncbi:hypothetical protein E2C01_097276 [Portunus trituberculatus]|uniref:Uncharacterized protein n=1 Tax=Portunus trituberculatus TaxID=210409 RepID=A0A5B7K480_PORTR|nr:hypothetical protein [Portunus trituberculatus]
MYRQCPASCARVLLRRPGVTTPYLDWLSPPTVHAPSACCWLVARRCPPLCCRRHGRVPMSLTTCWHPSRP